jgi:hypothetical protein
MSGFTGTPMAVPPWCGRLARGLGRGSGWVTGRRPPRPPDLIMPGARARGRVGPVHVSGPQMRPDAAPRRLRWEQHRSEGLSVDLEAVSDGQDEDDQAAVVDVVDEPEIVRCCPPRSEAESVVLLAVGVVVVGEALVVVVVDDQHAASLNAGPVAGAVVAGGVGGQGDKGGQGVAVGQLGGDGLPVGRSAGGVGGGRLGGLTGDGVEAVLELGGGSAAGPPSGTSPATPTHPKTSPPATSKGCSRPSSAVGSTQRRAQGITSDQAKRWFALEATRRPFSGPHPASATGPHGPAMDHRETTTNGSRGDASGAPFDWQGSRP